MARDAYLEHLAKVPIFSHTSTKDLRLVAQSLTEIQVKPGDVLMREGERATSFLIVVEGELEVRRQDHHVASLGPGEVVGEMAILMDRHRSATVVATTDALVLVGERRSFEALLEDVPGLAHKVLVSLAHRVADNERDLLH